MTDATLIIFTIAIIWPLALMAITFFMSDWHEDRREERERRERAADRDRDRGGL